MEEKDDSSWRRFRDLTRRILLHKQAELEMLEKSLSDLNRQDALEFNGGDIIEPDSPRRGSAASNTRHQEPVDKLQAIFEKYGKLKAP